MKTIIAFGLCVCSLVTNNALAQKPTPGAVLSSPNGRFVFGQMSGSEQERYMLDTQTGRLWILEVSEGVLRLFPVRYHAADMMETVLPPDIDKPPAEKPKDVN